MKIVLFYGSARSERVGIRAARFLEGQCRERGHDVMLIEPLTHPLPILDRMYKEYAPGEAPETLERMAAAIRTADAFIVVTGEYNHSIPPGLSNLLDHFLEEYLWRPSAIACYSVGAFGGVRAAMQMRCLLAEIGMPSISSIQPFPRVHQALDESGTPTEESAKILIPSTARYLDELEWYADAMKAQRAKGTPF